METKTQTLAEQAPNGVECTGASSKSIFQIMGELNEQQKSEGSLLIQDAQTKTKVTRQLKNLLLARIERKSNSREENAKQALAEKTAELIQLLDQDVKTLDQDDYETQLARLENGSRITDEYAQLSTKANQLLAEAQQLSKTVGLACDVPEAPVGGNPSGPSNGDGSELPFHLKNGLRWTMATAYQTCESVQLSPIDKSVANVQGINKAADGGRSYGSISSIVNSDYYYKNAHYANNCVNVAAKPLVYDYGGVAEYKNNLLNMFVNKGGGSALGVDCSAFASVATATAGLLYRKNTQTKPVYARYTTRDFVDPVKSNWSCFSKVAVGPKTSILPGDLAVVSADHMVGIDSTDPDPFGLSSITSISQCDNLSTKQFHFVLIQSAAIKSSIGINRYLASDYSEAATVFKTLFLGYAKAACQAKFNGKTAVPAVPSNMSIIRHAGTAECKAERVPLVNEACISQCREVFEL